MIDPAGRAACPGASRVRRHCGAARYKRRVYEDRDPSAALAGDQHPVDAGAVIGGLKASTGPTRLIDQGWRRGMRSGQQSESSSAIERGYTFAMGSRDSILIETHLAGQRHCARCGQHVRMFIGG